MQLIEWRFINNFEYIIMRICNRLLPSSVVHNMLLGSIVLALTFFGHSGLANELKDISQLSEQGQQAAALDRVNVYLITNPKDPQAMFMKGIILVESGKREDAIKTFTELTEFHPNLPEPYNNLAVLYADAGQYDKAKKSLETAIKTHPSYATAHENLGDIYARMASEAYDKALQLDNRNSRAQSKLSMIKDLFGSSASTGANSGSKVVAKSNEVVKTAKSTTMPIRPADKSTLEEVKVAELPKPVANKAIIEEKNISEAVDSWASAWSNKDLEKYLASYAQTFKPAKGESRQVWEQSRRERVSKPSSINVTLSNQQITLVDGNIAKVSFKQTYKAAGKPIRTDKTLMMKKTGVTWLIEEEIAGN